MTCRAVRCDRGEASHPNAPTFLRGYPALLRHEYGSARGVCRLMRGKYRMVRLVVGCARYLMRLHLGVSLTEDSPYFAFTTLNNLYTQG